jgi:glycosyltransferase involved in cell wall biosynthesis/quercetin dioxygenase-like cupin family protein
MMRIAMLSPIAWRTPPVHYGPWEKVTSLLTEGLVKQGHDVTLFATKDSLTHAVLHAVCAKGYEEDHTIIPKVSECLHISELFDHAEEFDIIHNQFDFLPLTYSGLTHTPVVTTIHGFSSPQILPVFRKYNKKTVYVSISDADRNPDLDYIRTIHHGIDLSEFDFQPSPGEYLLFMGRFHPDKGAKEAIEIARASGRQLIMAGIIQDEAYFNEHIKPVIDGDRVIYLGSIGPEKRNEILGKAAALLHPINFDEPFGLSVIESMACGTPVIAVNRGSMPELIQDRENGFLVSGIQEAIHAVDRIQGIDRALCRRTVLDHFTVDRMVENYIQVYEEILEMTKREDHRPWGFYQILSDENAFKNKKIVVYPGKRLSLQRHQHRDEHWFVVSGQGICTLDGTEKRLVAGQSVDIPRKSVHRIQNDGVENLVFTEVQTGDYFGEDDIERLEDDFGRN